MTRIKRAGNGVLKTCILDSLPTRPKESDITKSIRRYLKMRGAFCWKVWQGPMSSPKGISDILGCMRGKLLAIEVKVPGREPSPAQQDFIDCINSSGGVAFVAHSVDEVEQQLKARFLL